MTGLSAESDGDVLLLGHQIPRQPAMELDDLAIALRSAYHAGPQYQEPIGCTIDPREGADDPWTMQKARSFGIEPSAMAARHVAVDYEMKKASLGLIALKPGMPSLIEYEDAVADCASAAHAKEETQTAHRFWFCPKVADAPRFARDGEAIWIQKPVSVQVLTEQEFLDSRAHRIGHKAAEASAVKFAEAMTALVESESLSQHAALRNDFRLIEAAKLAPLMGVEAGSLGYYLSEYAVRKANVPAVVGGLWREESAEFSCENQVEAMQEADGVSYRSRADVRRSHVRVVGGVEARVPLAARDVRPAANELSEVMRRVRAARPGADAAIWDVAV